MLSKSLLLLAEEDARYNRIPPLIGFSFSLSPQLQDASVAFLSVSPFLPPQFAPTCPPLTVSVHGIFIHEQRILCWIIAIEIVETPRGLLTLLFLWCHLVVSTSWESEDFWRINCLWEFTSTAKRVDYPLDKKHAPSCDNPASGPEFCLGSEPGGGKFQTWGVKPGWTNDF